MGKPNFQRSVTSRILAAAPDLEYVAYYHADEERLKACMNDYQHRAFVYVLTSQFHDAERFIYVGQSKAQYARLLNHLQKYAFDHIYLFECDPSQLNQCEAAVIRELKPLYNRNHNPLAERNRNLLGIDYEEQKDQSAIHRHLALQEAYETTSLFGFALPSAVFEVLQLHAKEEGYTCSELLQQLLERTYGQEIASKIPELREPQTNLVLPKEYGAQYGKSCEQIKVYCRNNRLPGAIQIGRDWILPRDTQFPEDHRRRGAK